MYIGKRFYEKEPSHAVLSNEGASRIHAASCRVLQEKGMKLKHERAKSLLREAGAIVDGDIVYTPASLVEWALRQAPSSITLFDRDGEPAMFLEGRNVYYGTGSDTVNLLDYENRERHPWLKKDIENAVKLCDYLPNIDFVMSMGIISDVPFKANTREQYSAMIRYTKKPHVVVADNAEDLEDIFRMYIAVRGSRDLLKLKPYCTVYNEPTSPLLNTFEAIDKLMLCAEYSVPANYAAGGMAGATTPITASGTVVLNNAECLFGLVIHQLTNKAAPFVYGYGNGPLDMKTAQSCYAVPCAIQIQSGMCDMARYYKLPCWGEAGAGCSKICDEQSIQEATQFIQMAALQGCNITHDVGYLDFGLSFSFENLVIADDTILRTKEVMAGIATDEESLSVDEIINVGFGGNFLKAQSTRKLARTGLSSELGDFTSYENWKKNGAMSMSERAHNKVLDIIQTHNPETLDPGIEAKILEIVRAGYSE